MWCVALAFLVAPCTTATALTVDDRTVKYMTEQVQESQTDSNMNNAEDDVTSDQSASESDDPIDTPETGQGGESSDDLSGSEDETADGGDAADEGDADEGDADDDAKDTVDSGDISVTVKLTTTAARSNNADLSVLLDGEEPVAMTSEDDGRTWQAVVTSQYVADRDRRTITVSGKHYETYTQSLSLPASSSATIRLADAASGAPAGGVNGLMPYGDFNGNKVMDDDDAAELARALSEEGVADDGRALYDMHSDGVVDAYDVQLFATTAAAERVKAKVDVVLPVATSDMLASLSDGTGLDGGSVEGMLENGEIVTLKPLSSDTISEETPVEISIDTSADGAAVELSDMVIAVPANSPNKLTSGEIEIELSDGSMQTIPFSNKESRKARTLNNAYATIKADGTVKVDFGGQIAVKKIVIRVTGTESNKLADIASVKFLNNMGDRIPEPELNVPENLSAVAGDKEFTVKWKAQTNVTGYEVRIASGSTKQTVDSVLPTLTVSSFNGKKLTNGTVYTVSVLSVNGEWSSPYSETITVTPKATKAPAAPENVTVSGKYRALAISWKKMEDTDFYTLHYRMQGEKEFQKVDAKITGTSYTLEDLQDAVTYDVYLTGTNEVGTSPNSVVYQGTTVTKDVKVPWYKLINRTVQAKAQSKNFESHIVNVSVDNWQTSAYPDGVMDPWWVVDGDYNTVWRSASQAQFRGAAVEFDQEYLMDGVAITTYLGDGWSSRSGVQITTWDAEGAERFFDSRAGTANVANVSGATNTFKATFEATKVKKIKVTFARYYSDTVSISELAFYEHDPLEDDVEALWTDDMHVTLADGVKQSDINDLRTAVNTPEAISGEITPKSSLLLAELDNAEKVLNQQGLRAQLEVDTAVSSAYDSHVGSQGLNAWQPLGVVARAGEQLKVYVGGSGKTAGNDSDLRLIATQYHAESSSWSKTVVETLKVGANEVTIPQLTSLDVERGGALYVEYKGGNANQQYAVRVVGGTDVPVLDLHDAADDAEKLALATAYVERLDEYVAGLMAAHTETHGVQRGIYDEKNCILNSTDIVTRYVMHSVPASQVLSGLGGGSVAERARRLVASSDSADDMMTLFYQHKGLGSNMTAADVAAYGSKNALPTSRQNIRYMRMFAGAFMYAGGKHIGVEWDQTKAVVTSPGVVADANGKYESGSYFGWGIAHEVGHEINQGQYAVAEVTNNYFSQLALAQDSDDSVRWSYPAVYNKVTSGTKGASSDVFTQLAMYWQLHLAYDNGYNYKTYDTYAEQMENLVFARVDAYARNTDKAPAPNGVKLTLDGNTDNNLMRLVAAATQKDLTAFFEAWGMTPDETTKAYVAQFEAENRPIQYITDNARVYRIEGGASVASNAGVQAELSHKGNSAQVDITITNDASVQQGMLGYEVSRNGKVVGFVPVDESGTTVFTDTIATINNRVFTYSVSAVDKTLARAETVMLDPVKISTDGSMDKSAWTASTNMTSDGDATVGDEQDPCEPAPSEAVSKIIDGDYESMYEGALASGSKERAQVTLSFNEVLAVTALKYRAAGEHAISDYEIQISADGSQWETVKTGTFTLDDDNSATVYFSKDGDDWLYTYDAGYLRLIATAQSEVSIAELDVLGATGDDIELIGNGIGYLQNDVMLDESTQDKIPAGSLVFTGVYKGNPAYNAIKLYDQDGHLIEGAQVIFAKVPEHGELGETADGRWVYYIEPSQLEGFTLPISVRAELYRVDDAETLKGERLVADTLPVALPESLPQIDIATK